MFDIEKFNSYDLGKSVIEDMWFWVRDDETYTSMGFNARFFDNAGCPFFHVGFDLFPEEFPYREKIIGAEIESMELSSVEPERYSVKITYKYNGERGEMTFPAKKPSFELYKYLGMSYRNMYDVWLKDLEKSAYVESAEYFRDEETHELEDGFSLNIKSYADIEEKNPQYKIMKASLRRCELFKNGEPFFNWADTDSSNPHEFFDFVHHSNGHRYFPFHIELYGISYLDLDSGEVYHYIPEGQRHPAEWTYGESFIVTGVNYDRKTDLIAYEGCYWGGSNDVMVGDFSEPLNFDPHLISVHEIIDPEWEEIDDIDFVRFEGGELVVKCDYETEKTVSCAVFLEKIKMSGEMV
ncbi:MAG: hypothetical protein K2N56_10270 [Oscillospiraceae bacterium]|nr:hypothetical protein [Oscillospiraceae bacterium]